MLIIIPGNPNLGNIRNVVYFANKYYGEKISHVVFIDNDDSLSLNGKSLEGERNALVRAYIPNVSIESSKHEKDVLHREIPRVLSEKLKMFGEDQIVVDLTNGTKYISNLLYASASLSKIQNLFFLFVAKERQNELPENLSEKDYSVEVISALENLESIGKHTFFEIVYYRETFDVIIDDFKHIGFKDSYLTNMFDQEIKNLVSKYFLENYSDTITAIGQIAEAMSLELCHSISLARGETAANNLRNFNEAVDWLRVNFCDPLRRKLHNGTALDDYENSSLTLQNIDKLLDLIRVYRNRSAHPGFVLRGKEEAGLMLNTGIYLLKLIKDSGVFA